MRKKTIIFCDKCGTKNAFTLKKCQKCNSSLYPKFPNLRDYIMNKAKDTATGEVVSTFDEAVRKYVRHHFLGITLGVAVVVTVATTVTTNNHLINKKSISTDVNKHVIETMLLKGCFHDPDTGSAYNFISKNHIIKYNYNQWWIGEDYQGTVHYEMNEFNNVLLNIKNDGDKAHLKLVNKFGETMRDCDVEFKDGKFTEYMEDWTPVYSPIECDEVYRLYGKPEERPEG